ncbi:hypothetical protein P154DRAFT_574275 [Amniculicola lignicola CBS 123094]|uniref:Uncharacterized protein n=1 Tax=Amniculicola lignicola CBS 123094 TaxID=1392246 RepID=A0A6A5WLF8_9PLEO|nr:hypothetical protein P154DRAFT_574275 [Amniculicola lignicola CBS 123094]
MSGHAIRRSCDCFIVSIGESSGNERLLFSSPREKVDQALSSDAWRVAGKGAELLPANSCTLDLNAARQRGNEAIEAIEAIIAPKQPSIVAAARSLSRAHLLHPHGAPGATTATPVRRRPNLKGPLGSQPREYRHPRPTYIAIPISLHSTLVQLPRQPPRRLPPI